MVDDRNGSTEKKVSEIKVAQQLEAILDHIPGLVFYKDDRNNFIRVNKYVAQMHRTTKEALEGKNLSELYSVEDADKYYEDDLEVILSGKPKLNIEEPWVTDEGPRWVSTSKIPFKNDAGDIIGILGVAFDITEKRNAEQKVKILQQALEQSPASIVITETDGTICYVNNSFVRITGYSYEEAIGANPRILKFNVDQGVDYKCLWETILLGNVWKGVFQNKKKNGEEYWERCVISPIFDAGKIIKFVAIKEDITEYHKLERALIEQSRIDGLTGIDNRRYFFERAEYELQRIRRYPTDSAFLMLDIDHFKKVNDEYGHGVGDIALQNIAKTCKETLRETDILGRLGGEEFAVCLVNTGFDEAKRVAERLRMNIQNIDMYSTEGEKVELRVSIGLTIPRVAGEPLDDIIKRSDKALYKAKNLGRNRVEVIE